jgi:hypothetical protein
MALGGPLAVDEIGSNLTLGLITYRSLKSACRPRLPYSSRWTKGQNCVVIIGIDPRKRTHTASAMHLVSDLPWWAARSGLKMGVGCPLTSFVLDRV